MSYIWFWICKTIAELITAVIVVVILLAAFLLFVALDEIKDAKRKSEQEKKP